MVGKCIKAITWALVGCIVSLAEAAERPNIVFFLVDDLGIKDLACYGSDFHESPNIDRLAGEGMRFSNAYAAHPVCGPSRAAIVTGRFPARLGVTGVGGKIPEGNTIWPKRLKEAGYTTWFGGKWHLGDADSVQANGFDYNVTGCKRGQPAEYYFPYEGVPSSHNVKGLEDGKPGDYLTDALTDKALGFLDKHGREPFLLYFSYYNVHKPANPLGYKRGDSMRYVQGKKEHNAYFEKKLQTMSGSERALRDEEYAGKSLQMATMQREPEFASQIKAVDDSVGRVLAKLDELGVADHTIVIFTSDQGSMATSKIAVSSARPYRFGKGFLYEGGIRVPFMIKWPRVIEPGALNTTVTVNTDIYPTVLDILGLDLCPKQHVDGVSITSVLKGGKLPFERTLYWAYPQNHSLGHEASVSLRQGDHKLIYWPASGKSAVYNIEQDVSELNDLSRSNPELTARLMNQLQSWKPMKPIFKKLKLNKDKNEK